MKLRALKEEANRLIGKGKFEKAAEKLWDAIALAPNDAQLRLRHAECCRRTGQKGKALSSLREAAGLLGQQGHYARAQAALKVALELFPGHPSLQHEMRKLEEQRLLAGVANTGAVAGIGGAPFGGFAGSISGPVQRPRSLELAEPAPISPIAPLMEPDEEELMLEEDELTQGPVVMGVLEETVPSIQPMYPMIRRLSERALAIRPRPDAQWIVVHAESAIRVKFTQELEELASPAPSPRTFSGELLSEAVLARIRDAGN